MSGRVYRLTRDLHLYLGLFSSPFVLVFAISVFFLVHSWLPRIGADSSTTRVVSDLALPAGWETLSGRPLIDALKRPLEKAGVRGEVGFVRHQVKFEFQVRRPGHFFFIKADLIRKRVNARHSEVNLWGVIKVLHTFTGVQMEDARNSRDWALTSMWAYSMDGVAAGLIFMVLSSLYMWFQLPQKRFPGAIVLGLGSLSCGLFCLGLRWFF